MQDHLYTSSCNPLSGLQAISTMSSLSVHNNKHVDQYWTEDVVNINDGNDDDGNDVISNQVFGDEKNIINSLSSVI